jgi:hypothetical protein
VKAKKTGREGGFNVEVKALISNDRPVIRIYGEDTDDHVEIRFETQSDHAVTTPA